MKASRMKLVGITALSLALVPALSTTVFADSSDSSPSSASFDTQYQANVSQENTLLAQAKSYSYTNAQISALSSTVATLNDQIATLHTSEQVLVNLDGNVPQGTKQQWEDEVKALQQQRKQIIQEAQQAWVNVNWFAHGKGHGHGPKGGPHQEPRGWDTPTSLQEARSDWQTIYTQLLSYDQQLETIQQQANMWGSVSNDNQALKSLQDAILKFQATAITDTQAWIAMEKSNSSSTTTFGAPTGLAISNLTVTGWTVSWTGVTGANAYDVYLNGQLAATNVTGTSMSFTGKTPGTTYTVGIRAVNTSSSQQSDLSSISVTTPAVQPIAAPGITGITNVTNHGWTLTWSSVSGATSYNIYVNGQKVVTNATGTSYTFSGENANQTYSVAVSAVNASGQESSVSQSAQIHTLN